MHNPLRYEFESFAATDRNAAVRPDDAQDAEEARFSEADVTAIRASARAEGEAAARQSQEQAHADAAAAIRTALQSFDAALAETCAALRTASAALALDVGRTLADEALSHLSEKVIEPLIRDSLTGLADTARVVIEVHPDTLVSAQHVVDEIITETGFGGRIRLVAAADHPADIRIDWGDGGLERQLSAILADLMSRFAEHGIEPLPAPATRNHES